MKDSLREAINIDYQERLNKILVSYRPLGRKVKGVQIEYGDSLEIIYFWRQHPWVTGYPTGQPVCDDKDYPRQSRQFQ